jgi:hypothetical protein
MASGSEDFFPDLIWIGDLTFPPEADPPMAEQLRHSAGISPASPKFVFSFLY